MHVVPILVLLEKVSLSNFTSLSLLSTPFLPGEGDMGGGGVGGRSEPNTQRVFLNNFSKA